MNCTLPSSICRLQHPPCDSTREATVKKKKICFFFKCLFILAGTFLPKKCILLNVKCTCYFLFQSSSLISNATATALLSLGAIDYCLHVLKSLLEFWKSQQGEEEPVATSQLLRPHTATSPPDMSPFFLRQYVKVLYESKYNLLKKYI